MKRNKSSAVLAKDIILLADQLDYIGNVKLASELDAVLESIADRRRLLSVPDIRQFNNYSCGSACLLAILTYWGLYEGNEKRLADRLGTNPRSGTDPQSIIDVASDMGLDAELKTDCDLSDIEESIKNGQPVVANFQAWAKGNKDWEDNWDDGHYAIVIGIDDKNLYFRDPSMYNKIGVIPKQEFEKRWHDVDGKGNKYNRLAMFFAGSVPDWDDELKKIN